jgi:hypothetical protein
MEVEGESGVWLPDPVAREALFCLQSRDPVDRRLHLLEQELQLRVRQVGLLEEADRASANRGAVLTEALEQSETARVLAETRLRAWWRSPWLWASVGLVLGGLGVGLPVVLR